MKTWRPTSRLRRAVAVAAAATLATTAAAALTATPASAATCSTAGTLCNVSLTVSNNAANVATDSTNSNKADYTWAFTTGQTATIKTITMSVPSDTTASGTLTPLRLVGITGAACSATASVSSGLVTIALASCDSTAVDTPVAIQIGAFVNTASPTADFKTTVKTYSDSATPPADLLDQGDGPGTLDFENNTTSVTVVVPESLTFTNEGPLSIALTPIPAGSAAVAQDVKLKVSTNATGGYTLAGCLTTSPTDASSDVISAGTFAVGASNLGDSALGALASLTAGTNAGNASALTTSWDQTANYLGYAPTCDSGAVTGPPATAPGQIVSTSKPTNGDTLTLTNAAIASATQPAGVYTGTITYLVTPSY